MAKQQPTTEAEAIQELPTQPTTEAIQQMPQSGGTYLRNADGSLTKIDEETPE